MPLEIDHLANSLHESGYLELEKALEDPRSNHIIGKGAFKGFMVRTVLLDLSEYGLQSLNCYIAENAKKETKPFDYLLVTLQDLHVFSDDDRRFKKELAHYYFQIYTLHTKNELE